MHWLAFARSARARSVEPVTVAADDGPIALERYAANRSGARPAVFVLHGARGIELEPRAYERYADSLAAADIDAYLVHYFTAADARALDPATSTPLTRSAHNTGRFDGWSRRVSLAVNAVLARPDSAGRAGLLGFSLGGFVATQTAAEDARVSALAVLYGGMPDAFLSRVMRMPPVLELHGDADRNVPPAKGEELVALTQNVGAQAEQVLYSGRQHGFDFSEKDPMSAGPSDLRPQGTTSAADQ